LGTHRSFLPFRDVRTFVLVRQLIGNPHTEFPAISAVKNLDRFAPSGLCRSAGSRIQATRLA
jgi:hypothetical protein